MNSAICNPRNAELNVMPQVMYAHVRTMQRPLWKSRITKWLFTISTCCSLGILSGCASYTPPSANEPSAALQIKNDSPELTATINTYEDPATCQGFIPIRTGYGNSYHQNNLKPFASVDIRIPTSKVFGLYVSSQRASPDWSITYGCDVVALFDPKENEQYVAEFRYEGAFCSLRISRRVGERMLPVEGIRYRHQGTTSISRPSMHCTD